MWTATFINLTRRIAGTECNVGDNMKDIIEDIPLLEKLAGNRVKGLNLLYADIKKPI